MYMTTEEYADLIKKNFATPEEVIDSELAFYSGSNVDNPPGKETKRVYDPSGSGDYQDPNFHLTREEAVNFLQDFIWNNCSIAPSSQDFYNLATIYWYLKGEEIGDYQYPNFHLTLEESVDFLQASLWNNYSAVLSSQDLHDLASIYWCLKGEEIGFSLWGKLWKETMPLFKEGYGKDSVEPLAQENYQRYLQEYDLAIKIATGAVLYDFDEGVLFYTKGGEKA